jgi:hypothetical protein
MPIHTMRVSWQPAQPEVMPAWICAAEGAGVAKPVPGALLVADAGTTPAGVLARWQLSQAVLLGMCAPAPGGLVGGMPTMDVMPAKLAAEPAGRWQSAQPLAMPVWLITAPEKRELLPTGRLVTPAPLPTWHNSQAALVGMCVAG